MKRMADISDKRINNIVDTDVIENYFNLPNFLNIYEISGPLFFASARRYSEAIEEIGLKCKVLIIRMRHVSFIDQTGLHNLKDTIKILRNKHINLIFSGISPEIKEEFKKSKLMELISEDLIFNNFKDATTKACEILEKLSSENKEFEKINFLKIK